MSIRSGPAEDDALRARFLRFASRRDPEDLAAVFDGAAPRLLRVAMHVAPDAAAAEDLVQATFVTAMERADRFDATRPLVPWLTGILEHHARTARARAARRPDPARLPARTDPVDPAQAAHVRELEAELRRAVDELSEADRTVLVLATRHGLGPTQIADALGVSAGAVRVRLHRARERLRGRLPAGLASAGCGLEAVRSHVLQVAAAPAASSGVGIATTFRLLATMKTLSLKFSALGALLLILSLTAVWFGLAADPPSSGRAAPAEVAEVAEVADAADVLTAPAAGSAVPVERDAPAIPRRPTSRPVRSFVPSLTVRVVDPDGAVVVGETITAVPVDGRLASLHRREARSDARGAAVFTALGAGTWAIHADRGPPRGVGADREGAPWRSGGTVVGERGGMAIVEASAPDELLHEVEESAYEAEMAARQQRIEADRERLLRDREFRLGDAEPWANAPPPLARVVVEAEDVELGVTVAASRQIGGIVRDDEGVPVPGAGVYLRTSNTATRRIAVAGDDGRFEGAVVPTGSVLLFARASGRAPGRAQRTAAELVELRVGRPRAGGGVSGRVVDAGGRPVVAARIRVDESETRYPAPLEYSDASGGFTVDELRPGHVLIQVLATGHEPWQAWTDVVPGTSREVEVRLAPGWTAAGRVLGADGTPQEGIAVDASAVDRPKIRVVSGAGGRYAIDCLPIGDVELFIPGDDDHVELRTTLRGAAGEVLSHDLPRLATGAISGFVVDAEDRPLYPWRILATPVESGGATVTAFTRLDGSFRVVTEPWRRYRLAVQPDRLFEVEGFRATPDAEPQDVLMWFQESVPIPDPGLPLLDDESLGLGVVDANAIAIRVCVPRTSIPSARVRGRIVDAEGAPVPGRVEIRRGEARGSEQIRNDGTFATGLLAPGDYALRVVPRGGTATDPIALHVAPDEALDIGTITVR